MSYFYLTEHSVRRAAPRGVRRRRLPHRLGLHPAGCGRSPAVVPTNPETLVAHRDAADGRPLGPAVYRVGFDERPVVMCHDAVARSLPVETPRLPA